MYRKKLEEHRLAFASLSILALCGSLYMIFNMMEGWSKYSESNKRFEASDAQLADLSNQYEELQKTKQHASSITGMEMQIRSKFDVAKPEEQVVFIIEEPEKPEPLPEPKGVKKFFGKFKDFFE